MKFVSIFVGVLRLLDAISAYPGVAFDSPPLRQRFEAIVGDVGSPLLLTPLIEAGHVETARRLSAVEPPLAGVVAGNAGYLTVDARLNASLFFWFVRRTSGDWRRAPVLLWLQGGPGGSSLYGLFNEHGPLYVTRDGRPRRRRHAWTTRYNVLYIDQPVGTGFSTLPAAPQSAARDQERVAEHLYAALAQFFALYAELRTNAFYVCGESYAGKYVPAIARKIHALKAARARRRRSDDRPSPAAINLRGMFVVSGLFDPYDQLDFGKYAHRVGLIDADTRARIEALERECRSSIRAGAWMRANDLRYRIKDAIGEAAGIATLNDYRRNETDPSESYYWAYVESPQVRRAVHVGRAEFVERARRVHVALDDDIMKSVKTWIEELLEHYPAAFVCGEFDLVDPCPTMFKALRKLRWSGAADFRAATAVSLAKVGVGRGYYKAAGNLKGVLVRDAGHMVPKDQPKVTLRLLNKFVDNEL